MLKTTVKLSHVTNLSDARYASAMGIEMIGFCLDPNDEDYVTIETCQEIASWISGVSFVAELENLKGSYHDLPEMFSYVETSEPQLIQTQIPAIYFMDLYNIEIDEVFGILDEEMNVEFAMMVIKAPFRKLKLLADRVYQMARSHKLLIQTECNPWVIDYVFENINPYGLQITGSKEERPGFKDYDELETILDYLAAD